LSTLLLALGATVLIVWLFLRRRVAVLPGDVVYRDTPDTPTLKASRYRLAGRPDYVTQEQGGLVPVEVKSRNCGQRGPYDGERAQVLAYCLLVEEVLGGPVQHGLLQYRDQSVQVPFGAKERHEIIALLAEMEATREAHRSHRQVGRCKSCGFQSRCGEALA
jgi:CRISPR/Cas system-associated exonuclease Cas4 (RecB family)